MKLCALVACMLLVAAPVLAEPSPSPNPLGRLDLKALDHAAHRNQVIGNSLIGVGGAIGFASLGLLIASSVRKCPAGDKGCNDVLDVSGNWVGAGSLLLLAVGISFWTIGIAQSRIVKKLKAR